MQTADKGHTSFLMQVRVVKYGYCSDDRGVRRSVTKCDSATQNCDIIGFEKTIDFIDALIDQLKVLHTRTEATPFSRTIPPCPVSLLPPLSGAGPLVVLSVFATPWQCLCLAPAGLAGERLLSHLVWSLHSRATSCFHSPIRLVWFGFVSLWFLLVGPPHRKQ